MVHNMFVRFLVHIKKKISNIVQMFVLSPTEITKPHIYIYILQPINVSPKGGGGWYNPDLMFTYWNV